MSKIIQPTPSTFHANIYLLILLQQTYYLVSALMLYYLEDAD